MICANCRTQVYYDKQSLQHVHLDTFLTECFPNSPYYREAVATTDYTERVVMGLGRDDERESCVLVSGEIVYG